MKYLKLIVQLLLVVLIGIRCGKNDTKPDKPNILWIVSEDNSPFIGAYGDSLATTPNLDRLAEKGVVYENAFATTPVCAPSRFTLITGMYANVMGTENMRSSNAIPNFVKFFPKYLKKAGYYTTNNHKKDYNTVDQPKAWDESSPEASYKNRAPGQPFFHVQNIYVTHESQIHHRSDNLTHDPDEMQVPAYLPSTPAVKKDIAQYYDKITSMDTQVGEILDKLEESGEAENTIVFYYSDHGGVLPRSKRFMYESGLHIPLIVKFPTKYSSLAPGKARSDRLVSFVDFAPTILSLAGINPPEYMHGQAFLGEYSDPPKDYIHTYRGRMDERYDLVRAVRDKKYLYVHNYIPRRIYGQHLNYLWKAASMQSWYKEYQEGNLNEIQQRFFEPKPPEELYKVTTDPQNIHNLATDPGYKQVLQRMRKENLNWMKKWKDLGFIPESRIDSLSQQQSLYEVSRKQVIPVDKVIETAEIASGAQNDKLNILAQRLDDDNASVRFWAAMGLANAQQDARKYESSLLEHTDDRSAPVQVAVAEALFYLGHRDQTLTMLGNLLEEENVYLKLRVLNTLEALDVKEMPSALEKKVQRLNKTYTSKKSPRKYIRRASESILQD